MSPIKYPPEDQTDFTNADRGHIFSMIPCVIASDNDSKVTAWNNDAYKFIDGDCPETAEPSLWRQSQLCSKQGLYRVIEGVFQVRGLDISNMSFVETLNSNGVIIIDPLTSIETARNALAMYEKIRPNKVIKALIYTHSHADHFGGAPAVMEKADASIPIFAPDGFLEQAVSENVYAWNAMGRRAVYMFGESLPPGPEGQIGTGLGMATSTGVTGLVAPTVNIDHNQTVEIDGLKISFQLTPGTEAPAEMNFHFPYYRALCIAENATHTMHNIQTLRGAVVRDARVWSRYLDESITLFGAESDVIFASHHWPTFDNDKVITFLSQQRDLYAYLHNETLRLLNNGRTGLEIAEDFQLPPSLNEIWNARGYYGSVSHNVKAIYNRYMGWFDGNPAHLWEHPPVAAAERYVKCMGGMEQVLKLGREFAKAKDLRFAATLLSHAVFADQSNKIARQELSNVFTLLGYGSENATWRNFYLTGAQELTGPIHGAMNSMNAEALMALSIEQLMDTLAIRIEGPAAWETYFTIDIMITDMPSGWHLNMSNGTLTGHEISKLDFPNLSNPPASLTMWPTHQQLVDLVDGQLPKLDPEHCSGNQQVWLTLTDLLTTCDTAFAIVTPEKSGITPVK